MSIEPSPPPAWKPASQGQIFYPSATIRCDGPAVFRSQFARDVACLLDVDDTISEWRCQSLPFRDGQKVYRPDFVAKVENGIIVIDAVTGPRVQVPVSVWLYSSASRSASSQ